MTFDEETFFDRETIWSRPCPPPVQYAVTREAFADMVAERGVDMDPVAVAIAVRCYADVADVDKVEAYVEAAVYAVECIESRRRGSIAARERMHARRWRGGAPAREMDKDAEEE